MIITILAFIGVLISIICAVISILNAIDSYRYYKIKKRKNFLCNTDKLDELQKLIEEKLQ